MNEQSPLTRHAFKDQMVAIGVPVSDTVLDRLQLYIEFLVKWQKAINLVGPKTLLDPWRRHILDSAQLLREFPEEFGPDRRIVDLGSGAGLPGLIVGLMTGIPVDLVESDQRKSTFLREAARVTGTDAIVHTDRIETIEPLGGSVVTARALAPLPKLLPWVYRHLEKDGLSLLLKGAEVDEELTLCGKQWTMSIERKCSLSDVSGTVLIINHLTPLSGN